MAGWLHGVFVGDWLFVFPLCGFSLSLFCNYFGSTPPHMSLAFQALLYLRGTVTCGVLQSPLRQSPRAGTTRWGRGTGVLLQHHALAPACNGSCHVHVSALVPSGW